MALPGEAACPLVFWSHSTVGGDQDFLWAATGLLRRAQTLLFLVRGDVQACAVMGKLIARGPRLSDRDECRDWNAACRRLVRALGKIETK